MKKKFKVEGMTCSACQSHVQNAVEKLNGINKVNVNLLSNSMDVEFDENICKIEDIKASVKKAGYSAYTLDETKSTNKEKNTASTNSGKKLIIAAIFAALVFYLAMGQMLHIPLPPFFQG